MDSSYRSCRSGVLRGLCVISCLSIIYLNQQEFVLMSSLSDSLLFLNIFWRTFIFPSLTHSLKDISYYSSQKIKHWCLCKTYSKLNTSIIFFLALKVKQILKYFSFLLKKNCTIQKIRFEYTFFRNIMVNYKYYGKRNNPIIIYYNLLLCISTLYT